MTRVSRRGFLRGSGISVAIPFLPSLLRSTAVEAGQGTGVSRLLIIGTRYGWDQENWWPSPEAVAAAPSVGERARALPLGEIPGDISEIHRRSIWGELENKMLLLDGIDNRYSTGHQAHTPLIGHPGELVSLPTETLDVILRDQSTLPDGVPMPVLNLATEGGNHDGSAMSIVDSGGTMAYLPNIADPAAAFDEIFSHVVDDESAIEDFELVKRRRLSVIDRVHDDYQRTRNSPRLSTADRDRLDAYLQYLRQYEETIARSEPVICDAPARPLSGEEYGNPALSHPERAAAQITNMAAAIRCGVTNLATLWLMPTTPGYNFVEDYDGLSPHTLSHSLGGAAGRVTALPQQAALGRYFAGLVADLLRELDVEEDPITGRTFLDNTLVLWTNDMGSISNHSGARVPLAMFGGRDLIRQGEYVTFSSPYSRVWDHRDWNPVHSPGVAYNRVLETVAQIFGLAPEQYEQTGEPGFGTYATSKYYFQPFPGGEEEYIEYAWGDRRTPLVELLAPGAELP